MRGKRTIESSSTVSYKQLVEGVVPHPKTQKSIAKLFPTPWKNNLIFSPLPLLEIRLRNIAGSIREKPNWIQKMKDPVIWQKWMEGVSSIAMENYIKEELDWYATNHPGPYQRSGVHHVFFADDIVSANLTETLINGASRLENEQKDRHTDDYVLDLVHPSLYCLVFGRSFGVKDQIKPSLSSIGRGKIIEGPKKPINHHSISEKFQWLPSEFIISPDGKVKIVSYINNLHPVKFKDLYSVIAKIFAKFVPLFNQTLTSVLNPVPEIIERDPYDLFLEEYEKWEYEFYDFMNNIEIPSFTPAEADTYIDITKLPNSAQVIVKLENIELTPENPIYKGGPWQVEGLENENIVASGVYFYHFENVSESHLDFRAAVYNLYELDYVKEDCGGVSEIYGLEGNGPSSQQLGSIEAKSGRCIVFPNFHQHRDRSFELKDKTKKGSRKALVFYLVNPYQRIVSTANVPPQQSDWLFPNDSFKKATNLPPEVLSHITSYLKFTMSPEEAKKYKEELTKEHQCFTTNNTEELFERPFSSNDFE